MNLIYPFSQKYAQFLLTSCSRELYRYLINNTESQNFFSHSLTLDSTINDFQEFQQMVIQILERFILHPLKDGRPFEIKENEWKEFKVLINKMALPKEILRLYKKIILQSLENYDYSKGEGIALMLELEDYFDKLYQHLELPLQPLENTIYSESKALCSIVCSLTPMIITQVDKDAKIKQSMGKGLAYLGIKEGDLVGKGFADVFSDAFEINKAIEGQKISFKSTSKAHFGHIRYYQNCFFHSIHGAIGISLDITEQKILEEKMNEKEYLIQKSSEVTPFMIQVYDRINYKELYSNKKLPEILGYTREQVEAMGEFITELMFHPEDMPYIRQLSKKLDNAGDGEIIEAILRAKNVKDEYRWIAFRSTVFKRNQEGKVWQTLNCSIDVTEKVNSEEKLKQQLRIFDTALSNTEDYNYVFDASYKLIYANQPLLNLWKKSKEEVAGKLLKDLGYPAHIAALHEKQMEEVFTTGKKIVGETSYPNKKGMIKNYQNTFSPVFGMNGEIEAVAGKTIDITQIKDTAERQYRSIFQSSKEGILIFNLEGIVVEANPASLQLFGYTYSKMQGLHFSQLFGYHEQFDFAKILHLIIKENRIFTEELNFKTKETFKYLEVNGSEFSFRDQPHLLMMARDITERKFAEEALRESEIKFRTMAENIPNLVWIAAPDGNILWYNQRWYDYTGTNFQQMQGWGWQLVHDPQELPKVVERWLSAIQTGSFFEMVFPLKGADGIFRPFLTRVMPVKDAAGNIISWFGSNTDISEQIKAEETLEKKNKELIKINNDLDNFIYTASHDLKTPVTNLEGLLYLISEEEDLMTDQGKEVLPFIQESVARLKTVIKELTEIARIQKETEADKENISLGEIFNEVSESFKNELKKTNGLIQYDFSKAPNLRFSRRNLKSIIDNLLSNAIKYRNTERSNLVKVTSSLVDKYLQLTFEDNGLGIPEEQILKIFTMFKRFHTHVEGMGVGLYIVKRIIENAGGKIEVQSDTAKGSKFSVYFLHENQI